MRYFLIIVFTLSLINIFSSKIIANELVNGNNDTLIFWISIKIKNRKDIKDGIPPYEIRPIRKKPQSGNIRDYERSLWRSINSGNKISIGPFSNYESAKIALETYKLTKYNNQSFENELNKLNDSIFQQNYYWFSIKVRISPRPRTIYTMRTVKIASGNLEGFYTALQQGIHTNYLIIGPFPSLKDAKMAIKTYRLEEAD